MSQVDIVKEWLLKKCGNWNFKILKSEHAMKNTCLILLFASSIIAIALIGCKKSDNLLCQNQPPIANAGVDQLVKLPTDSAQLTSRSASVGGTIVSYSWT